MRRLPILLALVEKECGPLFQMLENREHLVVIDAEFLEIRMQLYTTQAQINQLAEILLRIF